MQPIELEMEIAKQVHGQAQQKQASQTPRC